MEPQATERKDISTRFSASRQPVKNGRPRESRDRLSTRFLYEFAEHFEEKGVTAIERVFADDPSTYLKIAAALLPKEIEITRPLAGVTEEQLGQVIALLERLQEPKEIEAEVVSTT